MAEHVFDPPERFVAGTVGMPGERTFYLQARGSGRTVSVALEKVQVAALARRLDELLDELRRQGHESPASAPADLVDTAPLDLPIEEELRVVELGLGWRDSAERVVIQAVAARGEGDEPDVLQVHLPLAGVRAFIERAERLVAAGRPPCSFCGQPLDPAGHICPRMNGHAHAE